MRTFTVLAALILLVGCDNASSSKPAPFGVVFQSGHTAPMVEEPTSYFYYVQVRLNRDPGYNAIVQEVRRNGVLLCVEAFDVREWEYHFDNHADKELLGHEMTTYAADVDGVSWVNRFAMIECPDPRFFNTPLFPAGYVPAGTVTRRGPQVQWSIVSTMAGASVVIDGKEVAFLKGH